MKEEISMNQKTIRVVLMARDSDTDILQFQIEDETKMDVNLNDSTCQNSLKEVFSALLENAIDYEVKLDFQIADGYERKMYIEVCREYIGDLNRELKEATEKIRQELER